MSVSLVYEGTQPSHKNRYCKTLFRKLEKILGHNFNFIKSNTPPWVFFTFLNRYQIAQRFTYDLQGNWKSIKRKQKTFFYEVGNNKNKGGCFYYYHMMTFECPFASCNYIER